MNERLMMKKILRAFENKDFSTINSLILCQKINLNSLIPNKGVTLLHLIIGHQSENFAYKITKLFLRYGGDPNVQSADGVTPTHVAAGWGRNRILHLLLVNGGDPWIQDDEKKNAFNYAFEEQEWNTIEMLHHFQQMYSAANLKQDSLNPKICHDLERVVLTKGDEIFAYVPLKTVTKSVTTQTQIQVQSTLISSPVSPIQDKIKYFEPNLNNSGENACWKKPEKLPFDWMKDVCQTSCEIIVHSNPSNDSGGSISQQKTFISSIHIDTTPRKTDFMTDKYIDNPTSVDVRGQLFIELQEAVRRRTKRQMEDFNLNEDSTNCCTQFGPIIKSKYDSNEKLSSGEKLDGGSQSDATQKQNMSDKDRQALKDLEVSANESIKTIDLCASESELTNNNFVSCDEEFKTAVVSDLKSIQTVIVPQHNSDNSTLYLTPYNSNISTNLARDKSKEDGSNSSFVSISEEYKYTDADKGVVLLEKKLVVTPTVSMISTPKIEEVNLTGDVSVVSSSDTSLSHSRSYDSDILRCDLMSLGYNPGPVTESTKKVYLKKLRKLKRDKREKTTSQHDRDLITPVHSPLLEKTFVNLQFWEKVPNFRNLEEEMCRSFEKWTERKWREGTNKTSFNYLLLDPRISKNLPNRAQAMTSLEIWKCFLSAIFYVGKGKRSRPYAHLYEAVSFWQKRTQHTDDKVARIIDIWKTGFGVVCLQVFQNIIPVEAFTREAAIIDALGLSSLMNSKGGEYYGIVSTWPTRDKLSLGIYLLHKALSIFLNEGEKQIKPYDID